MYFRLNESVSRKLKLHVFKREGADAVVLESFGDLSAMIMLKQKKFFCIKSTLTLISHQAKRAPRKTLINAADL